MADERSTDDGRDAWRRFAPKLFAVCHTIRDGTRAALSDALRQGDLAPIARPAGQGSGDITFGLDLPAETILDRWFDERAREGPLSVFTEDRGWRHRGPDATGAPADLPGFDHGGPRLAFDPVDGTRNLMADLRSAWTVVSFAGPGPEVPRLRDVCAGIVAEIPTSRSRTARIVHAERGCAAHEDELDLSTSRAFSSRILTVDTDTRVDQGYFPVFRYKPDLRPALAALEATFFARLARHEGADVRSIYDDQYISNAGQLVLLMHGTYRFIADARALAARRLEVATVTSKPYDVAGALVCAEAAGAPVTAANGELLDFPIDAETPVDFVGYANEGTRGRLEPHWLTSLSGSWPSFVDQI
jgi:hypothetical protein